MRFLFSITDKKRQSEICREGGRLVDLFLNERRSRLLRNPETGFFNVNTQQKGGSLRSVFSFFFTPTTSRMVGSMDRVLLKIIIQLMFGRLVDSIFLMQDLQCSGEPRKGFI